MSDLIRHSLFFDSFLATAYRVSVMRHGQVEATDMIDYLKFVAGDSGLGRLTLMAMLTDAGDEVFRFLRTWDSEEVDPAVT